MICGRQELHTHTRNCYDGSGALICGLLQLEEHVHGPGCFVQLEEESEEPDPSAEESEAQDDGESSDETVPELVSDQQEPHTHTPDCYDETGALICGLLQPEEQAEIADEPNPNADVESYEEYAARFETMDKTGPWNEALVSVAKTQLGYRESRRNYIVENEKRKGYTRYGAWYGRPYG